MTIVYINGSQVAFLNYDVFLSLRVVLNLRKSAHPDEMHLGFTV